MPFEDGKRNHWFPALFLDYVKQFGGRDTPIQHELPIAINSFGKDKNAINLDVIENTIREWFRISNDDKYKPVLQWVGDTVGMSFPYEPDCP